MNLPTFKPNDIDYARLMREWELLNDRNQVLERENAALQDEIVKANGLLDMQMKEIAKLKQTLIEVTTELTVIKVKDNLK